MKPNNLSLVNLVFTERIEYEEISRYFKGF